ncbi:efflux RND transporter permease subunit [Halovenus sp. HT40]|uniref:efflux RND transporter permease subunit n=1 Tax=Halovenus sp. HT40 TaxID=3126691 RepID=UPI00300F797B
MSGRGVDYQPVLDLINSWVTGRPKTIILVFLIVTALFGLGLPYIEVDPGEEGFTEGTDEQEAFDAVNEEFDRPFASGEETTQLIQRNENVLSREGVLRMLELLQRVEQDTSLRVREGSAPAEGVATVLDSDAETREQQIRIVESATDAEVRSAARTLLEENPSVTNSLSNDLNEGAPYASASIAIVEHEIPTGDSGELERVQTDMQDTADTVGGDVVVFGSAIFDSEFEAALIDSLSLMVPAVIVLILVFLLFAYRDPIDMILGLAALFIAVIWTFGFIGHARIPFNQMMVAIPPLLLAVGIDFGIHAVNRYREERVEGKGPEEGMVIANEQLVVAFFIVTGTTAIGFGANMTSDLPAIFDFGFVASLGIIFTFLIFGIFLPAAKLLLDELRQGTRIPAFGQQPLGDEDSPLGRLLPVSAHVAKKAPFVMLAVILLVTAGAGYVGTGVDTEFDDEEFLPYEDVPAYIDVVPEPLGPGEYQVRGLVTFLGDNFESGEDNEVTVYVEGPIYQGHALESVDRASEDPPSAIVSDGRQAESESVIDVIEEYAAEDEEFAALVDRNDLSGNGVPDRNLERIYAELLASPYEDETLQYVTEDLQSMRVIYSVDADASQEAVTTDARTVADRHWLDATATGDTIIFQTVTELLFASAIVSLSVALGLTAVFLIIIYGLLEGRASLGLANIVPIISTVTVLAATMALLDIPFNALTATILSITIGIGVDYSVHITHRFIDEYNAGLGAYPALVRTLRGTGGGITGSMITTAGGVGALVLSVTPMLAQFGVLMAISVIYSYLGSIIVLPPTLLVWERLFG